MMEIQRLEMDVAQHVELKLQYVVMDSTIQTVKMVSPEHRMTRSAMMGISLTAMDVQKRATSNIVAMASSIQMVTIILSDRRMTRSVKMVIALTTTDAAIFVKIIWSVR